MRTPRRAALAALLAAVPALGARARVEAVPAEAGAASRAKAPAALPAAARPMALSPAGAALTAPLAAPAGPAAELPAPFAAAVPAEAPAALPARAPGADEAADRAAAAKGDAEAARRLQARATLAGAEAWTAPAVAAPPAGMPTAAEHYHQPFALRMKKVVFSKGAWVEKEHVRSEGISGAHEEALFRAALLEAGGFEEASAPIPGFDGMRRVLYRLKQEQRGKFTGPPKGARYFKTVVDGTRWPIARLEGLGRDLLRESARRGDAGDGKRYVTYLGAEWVLWVRGGRLESFGVDSWPGIPDSVFAPRERGEEPPPSRRRVELGALLSDDGATATVHRGRIAGRDVALKVFRPRGNLAARPPGKDESDRIARESNLAARVAAALPAGWAPRPLGEVTTGRGDGYALELFDAREFRRLTVREAAELLTPAALTQLRDALLAVDRAGLRDEDNPQFGILSSDQELGGVRRARGEIVLFDAGMLKEAPPGSGRRGWVRQWLSLSIRYANVARELAGRGEALEAPLFDERGGALSRLPKDRRIAIALQAEREADGLLAEAP